MRVQDWLCWPEFTCATLHLPGTCSASYEMKWCVQSAGCASLLLNTTTFSRFALEVDGTLRLILSCRWSPGMKQGVYTLEYWVCPGGVYFYLAHPCHARAHRLCLLLQSNTWNISNSLIDNVSIWKLLVSLLMDLSFIYLFIRLLVYPFFPFFFRFWEVFAYECTVYMCMSCLETCLVNIRKHFNWVQV